MGSTDVEELQFDEHGLIPAIAQDVQTGEVRMLAYMNEESVQQTKETGYAHYWSRSRQELWKKGETSGELQKVEELRTDCDMDAVLLFIKQEQNQACHTGRRNCFYNRWDEDTWDEIDPFPEHSLGAILGELERIVEQRDRERPEGSYTTDLLEGNDEKQARDLILEKLGEEMTELIIEAKNEDRGNLSREIGDLLYHLLVLCREQEIKLEDVASVLNERRN
ncbi:MAG: bifunctional phosphoribosyl-AMP cyclohydrolase/phosphoribosyl-ATP diphosphatase HisIE [bacterium]